MGGSDTWSYELRSRGVESQCGGISYEVSNMALLDAAAVVYIDYGACQDCPHIHHLWQKYDVFKGLAPLVSLVALAASSAAYAAPTVAPAPWWYRT